MLHTTERIWYRFQNRLADLQQEDAVKQWKKIAESALKQYNQNLDTYIASCFSNQTISFKLESPQFELPPVTDPLSQDILDTLRGMFGYGWVPVAELISAVFENGDGEVSRYNIIRTVQALRWTTPCARATPLSVGRERILIRRL